MIRELKANRAPGRTARYTYNYDSGSSDDEKPPPPPPTPPNEEEEEAAPPEPAPDTTIIKSPPAVVVLPEPPAPASEPETDEDDIPETFRQRAQRIYFNGGAKSWSQTHCVVSAAADAASVQAGNELGTILQQIATAADDKDLKRILSNFPPSAWRQPEQVELLVAALKKGMPELHNEMICYVCGEEVQPSGWRPPSVVKCNHGQFLCVTCATVLRDELKFSGAANEMGVMMRDAICPWCWQDSELNM